MSEHDDDAEYFTIVFEGDIRKFDLNPFKTKTPFGIPVVVGLGDAFARIDELEEQLNK